MAAAPGRGCQRARTPEHVRHRGGGGHRRRRWRPLAVPGDATSRGSTGHSHPGGMADTVDVDRLAPSPTDSPPPSCPHRRLDPRHPLPPSQPPFSPISARPSHRLPPASRLLVSRYGTHFPPALQLPGSQTGSESSGTEPGPVPPTTRVPFGTGGRCPPRGVASRRRCRSPRRRRLETPGRAHCGAAGPPLPGGCCRVRWDQVRRLRRGRDRNRDRSRDRDPQ